MEVQTTIASVEQSGEWFRVKSADGTRFDTKRGDIAQRASQLVGQPVVISFTQKVSERINTHTNQPFVNRYLDGVEPTQAQVAANGWGEPEALNPVAQLPTVTNDDRGQRMGRNNIAAAAVQSLLGFSDGKPETVQRLLDGLHRWSETGQAIFVTANPDDGIPF